MAQLDTRWIWLLMLVVTGTGCWQGAGAESRAPDAGRGSGFHNAPPTVGGRGGGSAGGMGIPPRFTGCCPPSVRPDCCMEFGGADRGFGCTTTCDGMPLPDADWVLGLDEVGCEVWIEPVFDGTCCGCPPPDEAPDAGSDADAGG